MSDIDFYKKLNKARREAQQAKKIRSAYQLDEGLAEDLFGIAKGFAGPIKDAAKALAGTLKGFFKGLLELSLEPFKGALAAAFARMVVDSVWQDKAAELGIPEAVYMIPCPFWILANNTGALTSEQVEEIISMYGGEDLPEDVQVRRPSQQSESFHRHVTTDIFERWKSSLLTEEASSFLFEAPKDYKNKDPEPWMIAVADKFESLAGEYSRAKDFRKELAYSSKQIANIIVSSQLSGGDADESILKVAYTEVEGENVEKHKDKLKNGLSARIENIVALHYMISAKRGNLNLESAIGSAYDINSVILDRSFKRQYLLAKDAAKKWAKSSERDAARDGSPDDYFSAFKKFISGQKSDADADEERLAIDETPREALGYVLAHKTWYDAVFKRVGGKSDHQAKVLEIMKASYVGPLGDRFAKIQQASTIQEIQADQDFNQMFDKWWETPSMAEIADIRDFAIETNNDEIMGRLITGFRAVLGESFLQYLKDAPELKNVSGQLKKLINEASAVSPHPYRPSEDPAVEAYLKLREEFTEELIETYEQAVATLTSQAIEAMDGVAEIYSRAQTEDTPSVDVDAPDTGTPEDE